MFEIRSVLLVLIVLVGYQQNIQGRSVPDHLVNRTKMLEEEYESMFGDDLKLSANEEIVNEILMAAKFREHDVGFETVAHFNPAHHFFIRKPFIESTDVFKFIKKMPKGALLHVHDTAMIGDKYLLNITYLPHLYMCFVNESLNLKFSRNIPTHVDCAWQLVEEARNSHESIEEFDNILEQLFTLDKEDQSFLLDDNYETWSKLANIFASITPMLTYKPVWENYFYEALKQYRDDEIFYVEMRTTLPQLYDLDDNIYDEIESAKAIKEAIERFKNDYPDSFGMGVIYAPLRIVANEVVKNYVEIAKQLKSVLGDSFCGFDLVGQEDLGRPLIDFIEELIEIPDDINLFYHAGETNWYGTSTDYNLVDAVLLGTKRLGHAYALVKHPVIAKYVKEHDITVELNPISNQVLGYVKDLRNHPAAVLLAQNYSMIVSSDDPGLWGAYPISHDMYEVFMGIASKRSDLRFLKKLCLNSINYSVLPDHIKGQALAEFLRRWDAYMEDTVANLISA